MKLRFDKLLFALALAAALLAGAALADAMYTVEPTAVYAVHGSRTVKLGTIRAGVKVEVVARKGNWAALERDGDIGFAHLSALVSLRDVTPAVRYTKSSTVLYAGFTKGARKQLTIPEGEEVTLTGKAGKLSRVKYGDKTGYVKTANLKKNPPEGNRERIAYAVRDGVKVYNVKGKVISRLSKGNQVLVVARKGGKVRITHGGRTAYMYARDLTYEDPCAPAPIPEEEVPDTTNYTPARGTAQEMDWWTSDISTIFDRGDVAKVTDVETGLCWWESRHGGTNHADCQPLTRKDTEIMKKAYGGKWSWDRRAIFVTINGVNYAASMNGMPHGRGSIADNGFAGHHCIHFTNSRTHGTNSVCPKHQEAIRLAAEAVLK